MKTYYHFTRDTLRNGQPIPPIGEWLRFHGPLIPCESGLHASEHPFDALKYAPGSRLHLVELWPTVVPGDPPDKVVSRGRKILQTIDAEPMLRAFARRCALDVIDLWNPPELVKRYLATGDETLKSAARDAAWNATQIQYPAPYAQAAWSAAANCTIGAHTAWHAWSAACDAVKAATEARAPRTATDYRAWFKEMTEAAFAQSPQQ